MMCDECGKKNATVIINSNINGKQISLHLCSSCAADMGLIPFNGTQGILGSLFDFDDKEDDRIICPSCGFMLSKFNETGFLGCDKCYQSFESELLPVINSIQGSVHHKVDISEIKAQPNKLLQLKEELKQAIDNEEYEKAAQLRDEIKQLEKEEDK